MNWKRYSLRILGGVLALGMGVCAALAWKDLRPVEMPEATQPTHATQPTESATQTTEPAETLEPYVSPIDFEALWQRNPDIQAWFEMPGMEIAAPILYREGDNEYYLRRNADGEASHAGCYFMEDYNQPDFTDPVTLVYGHNMMAGLMFGSLQENYSNREFFQQHNTFTVYTPYEQLDYQVFAAIPYGNRHILYYHDFTQFSVVERFVKKVYDVRSLVANLDTSVTIEEGDRIVIFSTCLDGKKEERYLVMGVCKNQYASAESAEYKEEKS